jgi:hypothetical protein
MGVGIKGTLGMHGHPADASDQGEHGGDSERRHPAEALRDPWRERCRDRAANLSTDIDNAGEDAGAATGYIDGYRPKGALRKIKGAGATGEDNTGGLGAVNLRA